MPVDRVDPARPAGELEAWVALLRVLGAHTADHQKVFGSWCASWFEPLRSLRNRLEQTPHNGGRLLDLEIIDAELGNVERCFAVLAAEPITAVADLLGWFGAFTDLQAALDALLTCLRGQSTSVLAMDEIWAEGQDKEDPPAVPGVPGLAVLATTEVLEQVGAALAVLLDVLGAYPASAAPRLESRARVGFGAAAGPPPATAQAAPARTGPTTATGTAAAAPGDPEAPVEKGRYQDVERLHQIITRARETLRDVRVLGQGVIRLVSKLHARGWQDVVTVGPWESRIRQHAQRTNKSYEGLRAAVDADDEQAAWTALTAATERAIFEECSAYFTLLRLGGLEPGVDMPIRDKQLLDKLVVSVARLRDRLKAAGAGLAGLPWHDPSYSEALREIGIGRFDSLGRPIPPSMRLVTEKGTSYLDATSDIRRLKTEFTTMRETAAAELKRATYALQHNSVLLYHNPVLPQLQSWQHCTQAILDTLDNAVRELGALESPPAKNRPTHKQLEAFLHNYDKVFSEQAAALVDAVVNTTSELSSIQNVRSLLGSLRGVFESSAAPYAQAINKLYTRTHYT